MGARHPRQDILFHSSVVYSSKAPAAVKSMPCPSYSVFGQSTVQCFSSSPFSACLFFSCFPWFCRASHYQSQENHHNYPRHHPHHHHHHHHPAQRKQFIPKWKADFIQVSRSFGFLCVQCDALLPTRFPKLVRMIQVTEQHPSGSYTFILAGHRQHDSSSWLFIKVTYKQLNRIGSPR